jgi:dimethylargininase
MTFTHALCRTPASTFADGLTSSALGRPDYALMLQQHQAYVEALQALSLQVEVLEPLPAYPDAHFVEDVAVLTPEIAVITRPGAAARRGEEEHIQAALAHYRSLAFIEAPGTLDGGDVMQIEDQFFVGLSARTNAAGAAQLGDILAAYGYGCTAVPLGASLHLKSDVNYIGRGTLLVTPEWTMAPAFAGYKKIVVSTDEAYAANTLLVNDTLLSPQGFPQTHGLLREAGFEVIEIAASEARKMDGGLSCMSLRF